MKKILSVNAGSSSLKFKIFAMPAETVIASGKFERIGIEHPLVEIKYGDGQKFSEEAKVKNHSEAVQILLDKLLDLKIIASYDEISGVGHRVVAGGEFFKESVVVDTNNERLIEKTFELAPLHNPANLMGIRAFKQALPHAVAVAVFDTAFHQTMPEENYLYAVPYKWYENYSVRRYGAHGTSHRYVASVAADMLGRPLEDLKLISCHLGAGASICAIKDGKSFNTSMGFTPLAGVTMATRSGDVDFSAVAYMMRKLKVKNVSQMVETLNHESGMLGISGKYSDSRDILEAAEAGDHRAYLANEIFERSVIDYIGQYTFEMGGVDGIIFTAGIGENSQETRESIVKKLAFLGINLDKVNNQTRGKNTFISTPDSKVKVMRIMTDEELLIARDTFNLAK
ncbi:acetate kinase [Ligilactobacillus equi]|uniref:acetate/propionate family kinase n=1 Tax=Ligilactobacillus equi TaxID=137357 RepID=UPI002ED073D2